MTIRPQDHAKPPADRVRLRSGVVQAVHQHDRVDVTVAHTTVTNVPHISGLTFHALDVVAVLQTDHGMLVIGPLSGAAGTPGGGATAQVHVSIPEWQHGKHYTTHDVVIHGTDPDTGSPLLWWAIKQSQNHEPLDGSAFWARVSQEAPGDPLPPVAGQAGNHLAVNAGATGVEWVTPVAGTDRPEVTVSHTTGETPRNYHGDIPDNRLPLTLSHSAAAIARYVAAETEFLMVDFGFGANITVEVRHRYWDAAHGAFNELVASGPISMTQFRSITTWVPHLLDATTTDTGAPTAAGVRLDATGELALLIGTTVYPLGTHGPGFPLLIKGAATPHPAPLTHAHRDDEFVNTADRRSWVFDGADWVEREHPVSAMILTRQSDADPPQGAYWWENAYKPEVPVGTTFLIRERIDGVPSAHGATAEWITVDGKHLLNTWNSIPGGTIARKTGPLEVTETYRPPHVTVSTTAGQAPSGAAVAGDEYVNTADNRNWVYSGTAWTERGHPTPAVAGGRVVGQWTLNNHVNGFPGQDYHIGQAQFHAVPGKHYLIIVTATGFMQGDSAYGRTYRIYCGGHEIATQELKAHRGGWNALLSMSVALSAVFTVNSDSNPIAIFSCQTQVGDSDWILNAGHHSMTVVELG